MENNNTNEIARVNKEELRKKLKSKLEAMES